MAIKGGDRRHPADCTCGKCPRIGRPKHPVAATPDYAAYLLGLKERPKNHAADCKCRSCRWWEYLSSGELALSFQADRYLWDREQGKPAQSVKLSGHIDLAARRERVRELLTRLAGNPQR